MATNDMKPAKTLMEYVDFLFLRLVLTAGKKNWTRPHDEEMKMAKILAVSRANGKVLGEGSWDKRYVYFCPIDSTDVTVDEIPVPRWKAVLYLLLLKVWAAVFYKSGERSWR